MLLRHWVYRILNLYMFLCVPFSKRIKPGLQKLTIWVQKIHSDGWFLQARSHTYYSVGCGFQLWVLVMFVLWNHSAIALLLTTFQRHCMKPQDFTGSCLMIYRAVRHSLLHYLLLPIPKKNFIILKSLFV